jgi:hypothetical protein
VYNVELVEIICLGTANHQPMQLCTRPKTHAVPDSVQILEHLRNRKVARSAAGRTESLKGSGVALERVEGVDRFAVGPGGHGLPQRCTEEPSEGGGWRRAEETKGGEHFYQFGVGAGSPSRRRNKFGLNAIANSRTLVLDWVCCPDQHQVTRVIVACRRRAFILASQ